MDSVTKCVIDAHRAAILDAGGDVIDFENSIKELLEEIKMLVKEEGGDVLTDAQIVEEVAALGDSFLIREYNKLLREEIFDKEYLAKLGDDAGLDELKRLQETQGNVANLTEANRAVDIQISALRETAEEQAESLLARVLTDAEKKFQGKLGLRGLRYVPEFGEMVYRVFMGGTAEGIYKEAAETVGKAARSMNFENITGIQNVGVPVRYTEGYAKRFYNLPAMEANKELALDILERSLDFNKHPPLTTRRKVAEEIYNKILKGKGGDDGNVKGIKSLFQQRKIHFENADAEAEFFISFGERTPFQIVENTVTSSAVDNAIISRYGPNWSKFMESRADKALEVVKNTPKISLKELADASKLQQRVLATIELNTGAVAKVTNASVENFTNGILFWNAARLLGMSIKYTTLDLHIATVQRMAETRSMNVVSAYMDTIGSFAKNLRGHNDSVLNEFKDILGISDISMQGGLYREQAVEGIVGRRSRFKGFSDMSRQASGLVMRGQGAFAAAKGVQTTVAQQTLRNMTKHVDATFDQLKKAAPILRSRLDEIGIGKDTWDAFRKAPRHESWGFVDMRRFAIDNERAALDVATFLREEGRIAMSMPDLFVRHWVRGGSLARPGAGVRGGVAAETAWRLAVQFQSTQFGFMRRSMSRSIREGVTIGGKNRFISVLPGAMGMLGWGMAMAQMNRIMNGEPTFEKSSLVLWAEGLDRSGLLWHLGFAANALARKNQLGDTRDWGNEILSLSGPTMSFLLKGSGVFNQAFLQDSPWTQDQYNKNAKFGASLIPGHNLPIIYQLLNHMIDTELPPSRRAIRSRRSYNEKIGATE